MTSIEKLARRICWLEFVKLRKLTGKTEARYWESLPQDTRDSYIMDARYFIWLRRESTLTHSSAMIFRLS